MASAQPSIRTQSQRFYLYDSVRRLFVEIQDGDMIGRKESSRRELESLSDPKDRHISKRHCAFTIRGSLLYIEDLGSKNPARVNSVPVRARVPRKLHIGDVIDIGSRRFILTAQSAHSPGTVSEFTSVLQSPVPRSVARLKPAPKEAIAESTGTLSFEALRRNPKKLDQKLNRPAWYSALPWIGMLALISFVLLSWVNSA